MIPDYQSIMLPLLRYGGDQQVHHVRDAIEELANRFSLTDEERKELLPSGKQVVFGNRVGWARTYLKKAGLLESPERGYFKITRRGLDVLKENPKEINVKFLERFSEFIEFTTASKQEKGAIESYEEKTPEDLIAGGYQKLREDITYELLDTIKKCSPSFFEKLVVDLLVEMGYGGSRQDAGKAIGKSGDEGIDGIIKEDKLGLDIVYIQAKRWEAQVGRSEIQKFAGALQGKRARKGIFITTSTFSKHAQEYVTKIDSKIILIEGKELAKLMIDNNVGVSKIASYEIKKIDSDYFIE